MQMRKRFRRIKRFAYLGAFSGTVITARQARRRRAERAQSLGAPATWPPLQTVDEPPVAARGDVADAADRIDTFADVASDRSPASTATPTETAAEEATGGDAGWVAPDADGTCPMSHPIKANDNSMIYHQPGGRFYDRTRPERCYADPARAEADGYRAAKGATPGGEDSGAIE